MKDERMEFGQLKDLRREFRLEEGNERMRKLDDRRAMTERGKVITLNERDWIILL